MATSKYLTIRHVTKTEAARIFSHIEFAPITGCWNWTGSLNHKGYGTTKLHGNGGAVHRLMYAWFYGHVPRGVSRDIPVLDHACNNPRCCNPGHLELKTQKENILRGLGACANNLRKTHCPRGHPLPLKADLRYGRGRRCPVCLLDKRRNPERIARKAEYDRQYRERLKHT